MIMEKVSNCCGARVDGLNADNIGIIIDYINKQKKMKKNKKDSKEDEKYVIEIVAVGNNLYKVSISIDDGGLLEVRTMSFETFTVGMSGLVLKMR